MNEAEIRHRVARSQQRVLPLSRGGGGNSTIAPLTKLSPWQTRKEHGGWHPEEEVREESILERAAWRRASRRSAAEAEEGDPTQPTTTTTTNVSND